MRKRESSKSMDSIDNVNYLFSFLNYYQNICSELFEIVNEEINNLKMH